MSYNAFGLKKLLTKDHIVTILENLGASGVNPRDPNGIRSSCPIHGSKGNTVFVYNPNLQLYNCYGECSHEHKDGDIIKLVQLVQKCTYDAAIPLICEWSDIDIKLVEDSSDWILEEINTSIELLLSEASNKIKDSEQEWEYGVQPIPEDIASNLIGQKDQVGFIDSLGFNATTLALFESGFDPQENRWLLPIRSPDGILLGFDGRDTTNKSKSKWKKRKGILTSKLLGRLDIVKETIIYKDEICLVEGKKDQMALYEAGIEWASCLYGSSLSEYQINIISTMCSDITIFPDGDQAGYKMVQSIVDKAYPEYNIMVCETPDNEDPADLTVKFVKELYENRIPVEEWLESYKYRAKKNKK